MTLPTPRPDDRVVITGASQGIGLAMAKDLATIGHNLVLVARREELLQQIADELSARHQVTVDVHACDLADRDARRELIDYLDGVRVSMIINSAGVASFGPFLKADQNYETTQFHLNATAVFELTQAVLPGMVSRGYGIVCNVGSAAGNMPIPNNATYVFTKAGVNAFTEALHYELKGTGVSATLLAPGPVREAVKPSEDMSIVDKVVPAWLWTTYETCSQETLEAMSQGKRRVVPGPLGKLMDTVSSVAPTAVLSPIAGWFYSKMS